MVFNKKILEQHKVKQYNATDVKLPTNAGIVKIGGNLYRGVLSRYPDDLQEFTSEVEDKILRCPAATPKKTLMVEEGFGSS